ncbi:hypothetical protein INR49_019676 [Caranx melampygus]|nr:hypothetical protein INR49_019676 [Caranx melampygus]
MHTKGNSCCCSFEDYKLTTEWLLNHTSHRPKVAVICGSGLGLLADGAANKQIFKYQDIPNFPVSTVQGHEGCLVFGTIEDTPCVFMQGHFHLYEGYSLCQVTFPVRIFKLMGVESVLVTNASGGICPDFKVWDPVPCMSDAYSKDLRRLALDVSSELGCSDFIREGVYCMVSGPNFETIAEARMLLILGCDSVGMSTVPEVTVAKHCGLRVLGLSLITNMVSLDYSREEKVNHEEVLQISKMRAEVLQKLVTTLLSRCQQQSINTH